MNIRKYSDLVVWNEGMDLAEEVYRVTESFPSHERYALSIQMRRAAISIPSNIAEGVCRFYTREYWRFVTIALGSLAELGTQLEMARRLGYCGSGSARSDCVPLHRPSRRTVEYYCPREPRGVARPCFRAPAL